MATHSTTSAPIPSVSADAAADTTVALPRTDALTDAGHRHHRDLTDLVGELATRGDAFRTRCGAHNVCLRHAGSPSPPAIPMGDTTILAGDSAVLIRYFLRVFSGFVTSTNGPSKK